MWFLLLIAAVSFTSSLISACIFTRLTIRAMRRG